MGVTAYMQVWFENRIEARLCEAARFTYPASVPANFRRASRERAFTVWSEISKTAATA
jgi:hypothetical protein